MEITVSFAFLTTREYFDFSNREEIKEKNLFTLQEFRPISVMSYELSGKYY